MRLPKMRTIARVALLALAPALAVKPLAAQAAAAAPRVRAEVTVAAEAGGARAEVRLARAPSAPLVGSFSGEARFDPARFTLAGAEVPAGLTVTWNQLEPGRVRFAGVSPQGLGDGVVLVLRLSGSARPTPDTVAARLDEAFGTDARDRLAP